MRVASAVLVLVLFLHVHDVESTDRRLSEIAPLEMSDAAAAMWNGRMHTVLENIGTPSQLNFTSVTTAAQAVMLSEEAYWAYILPRW